MLVQSSTKTGSQDSRIRACYQCTPMFNPFSEDPAHIPTATSCPHVRINSKNLLLIPSRVFFLKLSAVWCKNMGGVGRAEKSASAAFSCFQWPRWQIQGPSVRFTDCRSGWFPSSTNAGSYLTPRLHHCNCKNWK